MLWMTLVTHQAGNVSALVIHSMTIDLVPPVRVNASFLN